MKINTVISIKLIIISLVTAFFLTSPTSAKAQGVSKSTNNNITYTKAEREVLLKKIDDLNKNSELEYGKYLTKKEQLIRLQMMKEKYPIGWYKKMINGFDFSNCDGIGYYQDEMCHQGKMLSKLSQAQIISAFLHYDNIYNTSYYSIEGIITTVIYSEISSYINLLSTTGNKYDTNSLTAVELSDMIRNKMVLNIYRTKTLSEEKERIIGRFDDLFKDSNN